MRRRDVAELLALAALWGGSFLFMRVAVPAFGPLALAFLRVFGAALMLVPLLALRGEIGTLAANWRTIAAKSGVAELKIAETPALIVSAA